MKFQAKPLKDCYINQLFGQNNVNFYKKLGLKGHNGLDLHAITGTPCYAVFDGTIAKATIDDQESLTAGRYVYLESDQMEEEGELVKYQALYFHLEHALVKTGERVTAGQQVGACDNTGQYTTGSHLHLGVYRYVLKDGKYVKEESNGFGGAVDPEVYFEEGWLINSTKKQITYDILSWEGKLLKEEDQPVVYLAKGGKLCPFTDELTLWSNGRTLAEVDTIVSGVITPSYVGAPVPFGKKIDAQILKEMVALFGNEPDRARALFKKYFN